MPFHIYFYNRFAREGRFWRSDSEFLGIILILLGIGVGYHL